MPTSRRGAGTAGWLAIVVGGLVAAWTAAPAEAAAPRLLFASSWSTTGQIYAVTANGRSIAQLTFGPYGHCPEWKACGRSAPHPSPDGRRVLFTGGTEENGMRRLFLARVDGRNVREVAASSYAITAAWSPDSRRFAFTTKAGLYVATVGREPRPIAAGRETYYEWSSRGELAYTDDLGIYVLDRRGRVRQVAVSPRHFAWAPDGRRLAYESGTAVVVVRSDGSQPRELAATKYVSDIAWSRTGRFIAFRGSDAGIAVIDTVTGAKRMLVGYSPFAWSPRGDLLAYDAGRALVVSDVVRGEQVLEDRVQPFEIAWSPGGRSLAYRAFVDAVPEVRPPGLPWLGDRVNPVGLAGDLRLATLDGRVQTLLAARAPYGGAHGLAWTVPKGASYRRPEPRAIATVAHDGVTSRWQITSLAADGGRIAYQSCLHVFVWTPAVGSIEQADPVVSGSPFGCGPYYEPVRLFDLAIAGTRVVQGISSGNMSQSFWLGGVPLDGPGYFALGFGYRLAGSATSGAVGETVGSGDLLVFSDWDERMIVVPGGSNAVPQHQRIRRVGASGCPCPVIAVADGKLVPLDVDDGRIVVSRDGALSLHRGDGTATLSFPPARAAALSGRDLVAVDGAILRHYDALTGSVVHEWRLPTSSTGRRCANPGSFCLDAGALVLEDTSHGRAAYVYDGFVHVLRLVDGRDDVIGAGTMAAFSDDGLVYASGNRLTLVAYSQLP